MDKYLLSMTDGDYDLNRARIIHIIIGPFPNYNAIALRIDQTKKMGADVQIWDIAEMVGLPPTTHTIYQDLIVSIKTKTQLKKQIKQNKQALFVTAINPEKRFFWIYFYLARFHCKHAKIANGWIREYGSSKLKFIVKIRAKVKKYILNFLKNTNLFSLPQTLFLPGYYWDNRIAGNPKIIKVNHLLYDQFLEQSCSHNTSKEKYILFLDEAHTHHPDCEICDTKPMNTQIYFQKMQLFFDAIEQTFHLPIVIAAHPKAKYQGDEFGCGIFGERKIFQNQTNELAGNAEIFLAHFSTTRIMPIIYHKPIYLIWLDEFSSYPPILRNDILGFSHEVGCLVLNETNIKENIPNFSPNIQKYNDFLHKYYIAEGYEKTNTLDIIGQKLIEECTKDDFDNEQ